MIESLLSCASGVNALRHAECHPKMLNTLRPLSCRNAFSLKLRRRIFCSADPFKIAARETVDDRCCRLKQYSARFRRKQNREPGNNQSTQCAYVNAFEVMQTSDRKRLSAFALLTFSCGTRNKISTACALRAYFVASSCGLSSISSRPRPSFRCSQRKFGTPTFEECRRIKRGRRSSSLSSGVSVLLTRSRCSDVLMLLQHRQCRYTQHPQSSFHTTRSAFKTRRVKVERA